MSREEFLSGLEAALSGNVPSSVVRENLDYYNNYIRTEQAGGRPEGEIMEELGDPRLIARTIVDTTPGGGDGQFEEYHSYGAFSGRGEHASAGQEQRQDRGYGKVHYYDLSKWYWKLLAVVVVILIFSVVITVVTGFLSLVIPLLPVIGLVLLIMWFVQGPRR